MQLVRASVADFPEIFAQMEANFVYEERRDRDEALAVMSMEEYEPVFICEDGRHIGFAGLWHVEDILFVEHLVTYREYRNRGLGAQFLRLLQAEYGRLVLEVEHPETEMQARRIGFYERNGFCKNAVDYCQPSLHGSKGQGLPLILMSCPTPLEDTEGVISAIFKTVYNTTIAAEREKREKYMKKLDIILDTDVGADCDDMMALSYLVHAKRSLGVNLKAITHSNGTPHGLAVIRAFFRDIGEETPPIGGAPEGMRCEEHYTEAVAGRFCIPEDYAPAEESVKVLRRALAECDNPMLVAIGPLTNIAALLKSQGDEISPLSGVELVREKCKKLVTMAGRFDKPSPEWNAFVDSAATADMARLCPVPIVWLPYETGENMITGGPLMAKCDCSNPTAMSFSIYEGVKENGGRHSWDPATLVYAVEGCREFFCESEAGTVEVDPADGATKFLAGEGDHTVLTVRGGEEGKAIVAKYIDGCALAAYAGE